MSEEILSRIEARGSVARYRALAEFRASDFLRQELIVRATFDKVGRLCFFQSALLNPLQIPRSSVAMNSDGPPFLPTSDHQK